MRTTAKKQTIPRTCLESCHFDSNLFPLRVCVLYVHVCVCAPQNFYLSLRSSSCGGISGSLPITARQLESLVRLAEARARVELRETVTADDAQVGPSHAA